MVNPLLPLAVNRWLPPRCVGIGARGRGGRLFRAHFRGQGRRVLAQTRARGKSQGLKSPRRRSGAQARKTMQTAVQISLFGLKEPWMVEEGGEGGEKWDHLPFSARFITVVS